MFKKFWTSVQAFIENPIKFLSDPSNTVIDYQVRELESQGVTLAEIDQRLSDAGMEKGKGPVLAAYDTAKGIIEFTAKNAIPIFVVALIIYVVYHVAILRKAVS